MALIVVLWLVVLLSIMAAGRQVSANVGRLNPISDTVTMTMVEVAVAEADRITALLVYSFDQKPVGVPPHGEFLSEIA